MRHAPNPRHADSAPAPRGPADLTPNASNRDERKNAICVEVDAFKVVSQAATFLVERDSHTYFNRRTAAAVKLRPIHYLTLYPAALFLVVERE